MITGTRRWLESRLLAYWYRPGSHGRLAGWIDSASRRWIARRKARLQSQAMHPGIPVLVVGNITVGGTGKTPLVLAVVDYLAQQGWRPGVVCRGHGGQERGPARVPAGGSPKRFGDEACLMAELSECPTVVARDRQAGAALLVEQGVNVIVSDDGLQHYRLARDIEVAVISATRGLGNGLCLPLGPLREPPERLEQVDLVLYNGRKGEQGFQLAPGQVYRLDRRPARPPAAQSVHAVTGIGEPGRFADTLQSMGYLPRLHAWPDHHAFDGSELRFGDEQPILVTEKDAIKLRVVVSAELATRIWVVPVRTTLPGAFKRLLDARLKPPV